MQITGHLQFIAALVLSSTLSLFAEAGVRDKAVVSLTFDDLNGAIQPAGGTVTDQATSSGKSSEVIRLPNGGTAVSSAFHPLSEGKSLLLDPGAKQVLTIASSEHLNRSEAVTVSGFFASLHPLTDNSFHGLFAKRQPAAPSKTNYGINFNPAADSFQVYVNDGTGYKVAVYSVKNVLGSNRRTHLSATFETADAPGEDTDTDVDDVRIRLFVNGVAAAPTRVTNGFIDGTTAWLQDVKLSECVSDTPFVTGGSFIDGELTRLICDDIHIFHSALSDEDAKALFQEVAGAAAEEILKEQAGPQSAAPPEPVIGRISLAGLTVGQTNELVINGRNLTGARLQLPVPGLTVTAQDGNTAQKAGFQVHLPANTIPGRYLLRVVTDSGLSQPMIVSIDALPQFNETQFTQSAPADNFPFAVSGLISGTEQKRVYFSGQAGQRIVAEIEARRLGSRLDPVVEIKTATSTPLTVQWQQSELFGDARAEVILPADGLYFVEVHDLQFRVPANSRWRLLVGDLPASSLAYPSALSSDPTVVHMVGTSGVGEPITISTVAGEARLDSGTTLLPLPALIESYGREVVEPLTGGFGDTAIDAAMTAAPFAPLFVNGRISTPGETDQILLTVTPGQALNFSVAAKALSSPLRAALSVFQGDARVGFSDGDSGVSDPLVDFTVPEGVTQLRVQIQDVAERGSAASIYRLQVSRKDRPGFLLQTQSDNLRLPANGSAPLRLTVVRQSPSFRYTGPIRLQAAGMRGISLVPAVIPASEQNQNVLVVVTRTQSPQEFAAGSGMAAEGVLLIEGQSEGLEANITSRMQMQLASLPAEQLTFQEAGVLTDESESVPAVVTLDAVPPVLLRGIPATVSVRILPLVDTLPPYVRFTMLTTEAARKVDPNNANSPLKPMVALPDFLFAATSEPVFTLPISVPLDTTESTIDVVFGVEFVRQPLSSSVSSTVWTAPIRFMVDDAVSVTTTAASISAKKADTATVSGTIKRHPQFQVPVSLLLEGAPAGFTAPPAAVAEDQETFSISVSIPEAASAGEVPNLVLRVQAADGSTAAATKPVKLIVE